MRGMARMQARGRPARRTSARTSGRRCASSARSARRRTPPCTSPGPRPAASPSPSTPALPMRSIQLQPTCGFPTTCIWSPSTQFQMPITLATRDLAVPSRTWPQRGSAQMMKGGDQSWRPKKRPRVTRLDARAPGWRIPTRAPASWQRSTPTPAAPPRPRPRCAHRLPRASTARVPPIRPPPPLPPPLRWGDWVRDARRVG
mmetsp:Transcript_5094/g.9586  ORF Transcript_5094/g.9586 Transcript_5094/m.9586 type:complete len:201 (+) Transcript_5094:139-741(+)